MSIDVEEYYRKYGPMVLRRCRALLKDEDKALDAMQDVFVKLLQKEKALKSTAPSSLLYIIATNVCLNIIRYEKRRPKTSREEVLKQIADTGTNHENRVLSKLFLNELFKKEKETTKAIAILHYVDRFTLEETAAQTGMSVSGIRKRLKNLRKKGLALKEV